MFQLQTKYCWCLALILLPLVAGESVIFNYPESVTYGENFSVYLKLENFSINSYDVRIDLLNDSGRIGKIYDNGWKSTYYYASNAINLSASNESFFNLNITEIYNGTASINLTLRQGSKYYKYFYNFSVSYISIIPVTNATIPTNTTNATTNEIKLELEADDEVYNDASIDVLVNAYNLENSSYDLKVYLRFAGNDTIISDTYNNESWKSSTYYVKGVFSRGNESGEIEIRLDEENKNFAGRAIIRAKLRTNDKIVAEAEKYIEIKRRDVSLVSESADLKQGINQTKINNSIIELNKPKDIKSQEIWKSKTQKIKDYSIYGFTLFCVLLVILFILKRI